MRNSLKVAKWEIIRNLKTKSFIIGLLLTPLIVVSFWYLGSIFGSKNGPIETTVYVNDEIGAFALLEDTVERYDLEWELVPTNLTENEIQQEFEKLEDTAYLFLTNEGLENGIHPFYTTEKIDVNFSNNVQLLSGPLQSLRVAQLDLTDEELAVVSSHVVLAESSAGKFISPTSNEKSLEKFVPGIFAGFILFSVAGIGMMVFQSSSIEKKDKMAEIILSSITPNELMNGKIIGYFVLGIIQIVVSLIFAVPFASKIIETPIVNFILVPETLLMVFIAILGYLLFAAIYAGIGATLSDMSTAGSFQSFIIFLPFLSFALTIPVFSEPSGIIAQVGSFVPFTSPGVLIMRLTILEEWPWEEIIAALVVLFVSIVIFMKLAGKIFKVGMLMYGKNATPGEIWKWIRS